MNKLFKTELEKKLIEHGFDETGEKRDWTLTQLIIEELENSQRILSAAIASVTVQNIKLEARVAALEDELS